MLLLKTHYRTLSIFRLYRVSYSLQNTLVNIGPRLLFQAHQILRYPCKSLSTEAPDYSHLAKNNEPKNVRANKMPQSLRTLLERTPKDSAFPRLFRLMRLARDFSSAGLDVHEIEDLLRKKILSSKVRNNLVTDSKHSSAKLLDQFIKENVGSQSRQEGLANLFKSMEDLEIEGKIHKSKPGDIDQVLNPSLTRLNYFICIIRVAFAIENVVMHFDQAELCEVEQYCKLIQDNFNDPALLYLFWMGLLQRGTDNSLKLATRLSNQNPDILKCLIEVLEEYSDAYTKHIEDTPSHLLFPTLPRVFCMGDISAFCDKLESSKNFSDQALIHRFLCCKSRALWNAAKFSKGLSSLAVATEYWLNNLNTESSESILQLGSDVIISFSEIIQFSVANGFEPAIKFFDVVCEKLEVIYPVPIIPYVCYIQYKANSNFSSKCEDLLQRFPAIEACKNEKFEKCLTNPSATQETKKYFVGEFVRTIPILEKELRSVQVQESSRFEDEIIFSPKVLQEILDVKILELLKEQQIDSLIDTIQHESSKSIFPTDEILNLVGQNCYRTRDSQSLAKLKTCLPVKTQIADKIFEYELSLKLSECHQKWETGAREEALTLALSHYKNTIEEEFRLQDESLENLLNKIRRYLRLYMEQMLLDGTAHLLAPVEQAGKEACEVYKNYSLLGLYWETFFFSSDYEHQERASQILNLYPKLPQYLDIDNLLSRADRYSDENLYRKLVEISLQFDLDKYEKSRTLESLLVHQCDSGNIKGANRTFTYAQELGITFGPDALKVYLGYKSDLASSRSGKILSVISAMFSRNKKK